MTTPKKPAAAQAARHKIIVQRAFNASAEQVFDAWLDPSIAGRWLFATPEGKMKRVEIDARVGGRFTITEQRGEMAVEHVGVYREITRPRRLVFDFSVPQFSAESTQVSVEISPHGAGCELVLTHEGVLPDYYERSTEGWIKLLGGLTTALGGTAPFVISRTFDAPRAMVWKAWTEREQLLQWFGPKGFTMSTAKLDFRPGGIFHYELRMPDGKEMWGKFVYREIVPPEKIILVSSFSDAQGGLGRHPFSPTWPLEMLTTTTFLERDGKTTILLQWEPLNAAAEEIQSFEKGRPSMAMGWTGTFEQLENFLANTSKGA